MANESHQVSADTDQNGGPSPVGLLVSVAVLTAIVAVGAFFTENHYSLKDVREGVTVHPNCRVAGC